MTAGWLSAKSPWRPLHVRHGMPPDSSKSQAGDDVQGDCGSIGGFVVEQLLNHETSQFLLGTSVESNESKLPSMIAQELEL